MMFKIQIKKETRAQIGFIIILVSCAVSIISLIWGIIIFTESITQ